MTWTGTGRPEGRQAYHAHEGGLCRPHRWPALHDAPIRTADWLATETQRCLHLLLTGLDLRERLLSREQDECHAGEQQLEVEQAEPRMRTHDAGRSLVVGYQQQGSDAGRVQSV